MTIGALGLCDCPGCTPDGFQFAARTPPIITHEKVLIDAIDEITTTFDKTVVDRTDVLNAWAPVVKNLLDRDIEVYGFFNNHFGGHAPDSLRMFSEILRNPPPGV